MEAKKNDKVKIERYSTLFFELGLVLALLIVYLSLEHKVMERNISELVGISNQTEFVEDIPITERLEIAKPPPPPPPAPEKIEIVEDEAEIQETVLESTETDQDQAVEVVEIDNIDEVVEEETIADDVPFAIIEEAPVFPGCKGTKAQKKQCFVDKIKEHVGKKFNIDLAQELGLERGKKKLYVLFRIDHKGNVADIQARGPHKRLESEALKTIKSLPKMTPAKQRGVPVGVKYVLPITFDVQ
jgi:protein TonB